MPYRFTGMHGEPIEIARWGLRAQDLDHCFVCGEENSGAGVVIDPDPGGPQEPHFKDRRLIYVCDRSRQNGPFCLTHYSQFRRIIGR
jgi:hypothetical protein